MKQVKKNVFEVHGNTVIYFLYDKMFDRVFRGVAVCQPDDVFDLETGKRIAKLKAVHKMQAYKARFFSDMYEEASAWKEEMKTFHDQCKYWMGRSEVTYDRLMEILGPLTKKEEK